MSVGEHQVPEEWGRYLDPLDDDPSRPPDEQAGLDRVAEGLRNEALWDGPPEHLRARLLARAAAERADLGPPSTRPPSEPRRAGPDRQGRGPGRGVAVRWLVAASAVAVLAVGGALLWPHSEPATFAIAGTSLAPRASAVVRVEPKPAGVAIRLEITGLGPAPAGSFYAAWLRGPAGVVPVGTFHWHRGGSPVDLWSGVSTDAYPELFVTLQREGAPPAPSTQVVLTGRSRSP